MGYLLALPRVHALGVTFDAHTLLFASLAVICGYQSVLFALFTKVFAVSAGLMPPDRRIARLGRVMTLERAMVIAAAMMLGGVILLGLAVNDWRAQDFGHLNYTNTMRLVIPGVTLTALGFQTLLSAFFVSVLGVARR
jgi:hypothetical protein